MRYDRDYVVFAGHFDWFKVVPGVGYVQLLKKPERQWSVTTKTISRKNKETTPHRVIFDGEKHDSKRSWPGI